MKRLILGISSWCRLSIVAMPCLLISVSGTAQRTFVREFKTAAVLLATGDTVQGSVLLHSTLDVLEVRNVGQASQMLPAASIQLFAVSRETSNQPLQKTRAVGEKSTSKKVANTERQSKNHEMTSFEVISRYADPKLDQSLASSTALMPLSAGVTPLYVQERQRQERKRLGKNYYFYRPDSTRISIFRTFKINKGLAASVGAPAFFEQLTNGPVLLLRRQELYNQLHDNLYVVQPNSTELPTALYLHHPRKQLFAFFAGHTQQLEQYVKENRLDFANTQAVEAFVTYANSLQLQE